MTERRTYKLTWWFLAIVLATLPFWSAVVAFLSVRTGLTPHQLFMVRVWYEPVLIILFLLTVFNPKWETHKLDLRVLDYLIISYLLWAIASIFISGESISQGIQGLRYNGLFLGFYLLCRFSFFPEARVLMLSKIIIVAGRVMAVWAVFESLILGSGYWQSFGILPETSTFGFGAQHNIINVPQAMATLEGPNQLGSFLLLPFFLSLFYKSNDEKKKPWHHWLWLGLMALAIVLTFSRSAILGLVIGIIIYLLAEKSVKIKTKISIFLSLGLLILASLWYFGYHGGIGRDFLTHGTSSSQHWYSMYTSAMADRTPFQIIFGQGIGTAGPSSFNFLPQVPESWYIQVFIELGIVGLLLWLAIITTVIIKYFSRFRGLVLALISISIAAIFLHTWADNPAVAISFWILLGVLVNQKVQNSKL